MLRVDAELVKLILSTMLVDQGSAFIHSRVICILFYLGVFSN